MKLTSLSILVACLLCPSVLFAAEKERASKAEKAKMAAEARAAKKEKAKKKPSKTPAKKRPGKQAKMPTEEEKIQQRIAMVDFEALRLAVKDMQQDWPDRYKSASAILKKIDQYEKALPALGTGEEAKALLKFKRDLLLSNPLLDFDRMLVMRRNFDTNARKVISGRIGTVTLNSRSLESLQDPADGWDNEIALMTNLRGEPKLETVYKPDRKSIVCDMDLHFDADRILFSSVGTHDRWHVFEIGVDGKKLTQLTPKELPDVHHFDACYLPNDDIIFASTAVYQGVPCQGGKDSGAVLYRLYRDTNKIRQLCFEQDSDWCPRMMKDGRVMYLRWEYSDLPHFYSRILMSMNPDGTGQRELYGSGSHFPNGIYYARPVPGNSKNYIGILSGHHGVARSGRMVLFDPSISRFEHEGMIHEFPLRGQAIDATIKDRLVDGVWPHFIHPMPLNDKYTLVSMKASQAGLWGIYLVDVFNNMTLIKEIENEGLFEPVPLMKRPVPPMRPELVVPDAKEATVTINDIYYGRSMPGVPRGTVKALRVFAYDYNYNLIGGHASQGVEACWDVKRVLGTVPVYEDGSTTFTIPANTPISVQPLDQDGAAIQIMRSWFVGMPGEAVSCIGCHEDLNEAPPPKRTIAGSKAPLKITPWQGDVRPFAFRFEVQPVLDKYCVSCHNGSEEDRPNFADRYEAEGDGISSRDKVADRRLQTLDISDSYMALHPYVRRPGPESDMMTFKPMEYHASSSELIQLLHKGHYGVKLDREAWERLYTWIDLNVPFKGHWNPGVYNEFPQVDRRMELAQQYAGISVSADQEYLREKEKYLNRPRVEPVRFKKPKVEKSEVKVSGWPFEPKPVKTSMLKLKSGHEIKLARIPAGRFAMGSWDEDAAERPVCPVAIEKPFWMGTVEISNELYNLFDPEHDSRYIDQEGKDIELPGYPANLPEQPVIRISWQQAMDFCAWLSKQTGRKVTLPTEAQWEWAARAGSDQPFYFGGGDADFGEWANLADTTLHHIAVKKGASRGAQKGKKYSTFVPLINEVDDGQMTLCAVGSYKPNAWGLHDMHGNVAEWTRSDLRPYPYRDGVLDPGAAKVVRGGSWRERPKRSTASFRIPYQPWQKVYNTGFRIVVVED